MAFDGYDNVTVLFGGYNGSAGTPIFGDTWIYTHGIWAQVSTSTGPSARSGDRMVYVPALHGVLLFGGEDFSVYNSETWLFSAGTWTQLNPAHSPSARSQYAMAYDPAIQQVVLFGGYDGSVLNDTWEFNGTDWHQVARTSHIRANEYAAIAYDAIDKEVVLFGGLHTSSIFTGTTWVFHGGKWSWVNTSYHPSATVLTMATTLPNGTVLIYGGGLPTTASTYTSATWEFHNGTWFHVSFPHTPFARMGGGLVFDPVDHYAIMYGGNAGSLGWLGDTWALVNLPP